MKENSTDQYLALISQQADTDGLLPQGFSNTLGLQLWQLLGEQTKRYTMGDSSSVPVEIAQELQQSIRYCVGVHLKAVGGYPEQVNALKDRELTALFEAGRKDIAALLAACKELYKKVDESALDINNLSYRDTLRALPDFFKRYDLYYFAHDIPCDIDYQLCCPLPADLQGVEYIHAYLSSLLAENEFCGKFRTDNITALLDAYCPDYQGLLINLFDPTFTNTAGLALLGKDTEALDITRSDRADLMKLLGPLGEEEIKARLQTVVQALWDEPHLSPNVPAYLQEASDALAVRIVAAKEVGSFDALFLSFPQEETQDTVEFEDGELLEAEELRALIEEIQDCHYLSQKIFLLKIYIHSLQDFLDVLTTCFFPDEFAQVFLELGDMEIAVLLRYLKTQYADDEPAWGISLAETVKTMPMERQRRIARCLRME